MGGQVIALGQSRGPGIREELTVFHLTKGSWVREGRGGGTGGQVLGLGTDSRRGQKAAEQPNEACTVRERCLQLGRGGHGQQPEGEPSSPQNNSPLLRERLERIEVGIIQKSSGEAAGSIGS